MRLTKQDNHIMDMTPLLKKIARELFESQFSQWSYKLPKDPEQILYDFYFLSHFAGSRDTGNEDLDFALEEAVKETTDSLKKHMLKAVKWAICCEMRHVFDYSEWGGDPYDEEDMADNKIKWSPKTIEFLKRYGRHLGKIEPHVFSNKQVPHYKWVKNKKTGKKKKVLSWTETVKTKKPFEEPKLGKPANIKKRMTGPLSKQRPLNWSERTESYRAVISALKDLNYSSHDFAKVSHEIFNAPIWGNGGGGFGGKAWVQIVQGWLNLLNAETISQKFTWIDHIYDLQHNNDTVFDKVKSYYKSDERSTDYGDEVGFDWLADALDWKRDVKDIREYYKLVSTELKPVVAYISKQRYQKTMEDPLEMTHKTNQKPWDGGHWTGGTWEGGIWKNGIWQKGTWEDGIWQKGTWEDGIWQNGTWKNGTWKNGTWNNGEWETGKIWSKKFKEFIKSDTDPRYFYKKEKTAKTIEDLKDRVN